MDPRIQKLVDKTKAGLMRVEPVPTEYDRADILLLTPMEMSAKRVCQYIVNQEPKIEEESLLTGMLSFDGTVEGNLFQRNGHAGDHLLYLTFYNNPCHDLLTYECQHSVGDFGKIVRSGLCGVREEINASEAAHADDPEGLAFLQTQRQLCDAYTAWAHKCSRRAAEKAEETADPAYRSNLLRLSEALLHVPEHPARSFYEAVLTVYISYPFLPDSIGLIDRYLFPYYQADIAAGRETRESCKAYLQELMLEFQARIPITSDRFYRGGETHFCIGGYLPDGTDGFNDLSLLIVEGLMELPTWIPQISLRWTEKTPPEVLPLMLDYERHDPNKRIAFVNDEPRLKGLMAHTGLSFEEAVSYSMIGCNEIALPGGMVQGFDPLNLGRSLGRVFHQCDLGQITDFEAFYRLYEAELLRDLDEADRIEAGYMAVRERDCNLVSSMFIHGCIERARSATQGGCSCCILVGDLIGITTVVDSLAVVRQFVFEEQRLSLAKLTEALKADWVGYEDLRRTILEQGRFFGNGDDLPDGILRRVLDSIRQWNESRHPQKRWVFGNLIGYNEHNAIFGRTTPATPDGRHAGERISFGLGQTEGRDRSGLTALLQSVAQCDPNHLLVGPSVTNVLLDEQLVKNDAHFEKLAPLFEAYFRQGGTHFQLSYVAVEDLKQAQVDPDTYRNLRVRVSGFSDYFVLLNRQLQDEIVCRTTHVST